MSTQDVPQWKTLLNVFFIIQICQHDTKIIVAQNIYKVVDVLGPNWPMLESAFNSSIPNNLFYIR